MYNIGDKFIIEIGGTYGAWSSCKEEWEKDHNSTLYRIKGFRSLVFDENGLNKLQKYEEKKQEKKWVFTADKGIAECISCPKCGEEFGYAIRKYDWCPKCGEFNGAEKG